MIKRLNMKGVALVLAVVAVFCSCLGVFIQPKAKADDISGFLVPDISGYLPIANCGNVAISTDNGDLKVSGTDKGTNENMCLLFRFNTPKLGENYYGRYVEPTGKTQDKDGKTLYGYNFYGSYHTTDTNSNGIADRIYYKDKPAYGSNISSALTMWAGSYGVFPCEPVYKNMMDFISTHPEYNTTYNKLLGEVLKDLDVSKDDKLTDEELVDSKCMLLSKVITSGTYMKMIDAGMPDIGIRVQSKTFQIPNDGDKTGTIDTKNECYWVDTDKFDVNEGTEIRLSDLIKNTAPSTLSGVSLKLNSVEANKVQYADLDGNTTEPYYTYNIDASLSLDDSVTKAGYKLGQATYRLSKSDGTTVQKTYTLADLPKKGNDLKLTCTSDVAPDVGNLYSLDVRLSLIPKDKELKDVDDKDIVSIPLIAQFKAPKATDLIDNSHVEAPSAMPEATKTDNTESVKLTYNLGNITDNKLVVKVSADKPSILSLNGQSNSNAYVTSTEFTITANGSYTVSAVTKNGGFDSQTFEVKDIKENSPQVEAMSYTYTNDDIYSGSGKGGTLAQTGVTRMYLIIAGLLLGVLALGIFIYAKLRDKGIINKHTFLSLFLILGIIGTGLPVSNLGRVDTPDLSSIAKALSKPKTAKAISVTTAGSGGGVFNGRAHTKTYWGYLSTSTCEVKGCYQVGGGTTAHIYGYSNWHPDSNRYPLNKTKNQGPFLFEYGDLDSAIDETMRLSGGKWSATKDGVIRILNSRGIAELPRLYWYNWGNGTYLDYVYLKDYVSVSYNTYAGVHATSHIVNDADLGYSNNLKVRTVAEVDNTSNNNYDRWQYRSFGYPANAITGSYGIATGVANGEYYVPIDTNNTKYIQGWASWAQPLAGRRSVQNALDVFSYAAYSFSCSTTTKSNAIGNVWDSSQAKIWDTVRSHDVNSADSALAYANATGASSVNNQTNSFSGSNLTNARSKGTTFTLSADGGTITAGGDVGVAAWVCQKVDKVNQRYIELTVDPNTNTIVTSADTSESKYSTDWKEYNTGDNCAAVWYVQNNNDDSSPVDTNTLLSTASKDKTSLNAVINNIDSLGYNQFNSFTNDNKYYVGRAGATNGSGNVGYTVIALKYKNLNDVNLDADITLPDYELNKYFTNTIFSLYHTTVGTFYAPRGTNKTVSYSYNTKGNISDTKSTEYLKNGDTSTFPQCVGAYPMSGTGTRNIRTQGNVWADSHLMLGRNLVGDNRTISSLVYNPAQENVTWLCANLGVDVNSTPKTVKQADALRNSTASVGVGKDTFVFEGTGGLQYKGWAASKISLILNEYVQKYSETDSKAGKSPVNDSFVDYTKATNTDSSSYNAAYVENFDGQVAFDYFPEVKMMVEKWMSSQSINRTGIWTIGEKKRSTSPVGLYIMSMRNANGTGATGSVMSDNATTGQASSGGANKLTVYSGSDISVKSKIDAKLHTAGYVLDTINYGVDKAGFKNADGIIRQSYKSVIPTSIDPKYTSKYTDLKSDYTDWIKQVQNKDNYGADLTMNVGNNVYATGFSTSLGNIADVTGSITDAGSYPLEFANGSINRDGTGYKALIAQIMLDYNCTKKTATEVFDKTGIEEAMRDSVVSSTSEGNKSQAVEGFGNKNHWYDEYVRTFVVRRFTNNDIEFGNVAVTDKIDYSLSDSANKNSTKDAYFGISLYFKKGSIRGTNAFTEFDNTTSDNTKAVNSGDVFINNIKVTGTDFKISGSTTDTQSW